MAAETSTDWGLDPFPHARLRHPCRLLILAPPFWNIFLDRTERARRDRRQIGEPAFSCAAFAHCSGAASSTPSSKPSTARSKLSTPTSPASQPAIPMAANGPMAGAAVMMQGRMCAWRRPAATAAAEAATPRRRPRSLLAATSRRHRPGQPPAASRRSNRTGDRKRACAGSLQRMPLCCSNSLICGKIRGNFANLAAKAGRRRGFPTISQLVTPKFPTHPNREFSGANRKLFPA